MGGRPAFVLAGAACCGALSACSEQWRHEEHVDRWYRRLADGPNLVRESEDDCLVRHEHDACEAMTTAYATGLGVRPREVKAAAYGYARKKHSEAEERDAEADCLRTGYRKKCAEAGRSFLWGLDVDADVNRALPLLERVCATVTPDAPHEWDGACADLGYLLLFAKPPVGNPVRAVSILDRHCSYARPRAGSARACTYLAMAAELGLGGVVKDTVAAEIAYGTACSLRSALVETPTRRRDLTRASRDPLACYRLGGMVERGEATGGLVVAAKLYADACFTPTDEFPSVSGGACTRAAEIHYHHGWTYERVESPGLLGGEMVYPELADAFDLAAHGCVSGALGSCAVLKSIYDEREASGQWFDLRDD